MYFWGVTALPAHDIHGDYDEEEDYIVQQNSWSTYIATKIEVETRKLMRQTWRLIGML